MKRYIVFIMIGLLIVGCSKESTEDKNTAVKDTDKTETVNSISKKEEYLKMLDAVEESIKEFDESTENGSQSEMNQVQTEIFKKWDIALNEIYGELEKTLPQNEMNQLREKQREWIKYRDATAQEESNLYEGGTLQPLQYADTLTRITKERCYELVENYMK